MNQFDFSNRLYYLVLAFVVSIFLFVGAIVIGVVSSVNTSTAAQIVVSGQGKASATPDIAVISFGITKEAKTVDVATEESTKLMNEIIATLKELGVKKEDLRTTNYSVYPTYQYTRDGRSIPTGYSHNQQVEVKIRDFDNVSKVIEVTTEKGANMIGSLYFTLDDPDKAKNEARAEAIKKAKEKAEILAEESGLELGDIINVSESSVNPSAPYPMYDMAVSEEANLKSVGNAPNIEPGQQEVTVYVDLTYELE